MKKSNLYFTIFYFCGILLSCQNNSKVDPITPEVKTEVPKSNIPVLDGSIYYKAYATSDDSTAVRLFYEFSPSEVFVYFSKNKFRLIETGGLSKGNILINTEIQKAWHLDTSTNIATEGIYSDFDNASEILKNEMPDHYAPTLEETNETENILGFDCKKYIVLRSGFIRDNSLVSIWATNTFKFPHARYDVQTSVNHVTAPLPLIIGFQDGIILKMEIEDEYLSVKYVAEKIDTGKIDNSIFEIPGDYQQK